MHTRLDPHFPTVGGVAAYQHAGASHNTPSFLFLLLARRACMLTIYLIFVCLPKYLRSMEVNTNLIFYDSQLDISLSLLQIFLQMF